MLYIRIRDQKIVYDLFSGEIVVFEFLKFMIFFVNFLWGLILNLGERSEKGVCVMWLVTANFSDSDAWTEQ